MLGECLMASRQVEGLRAQVASDIKATLSEAATPLAVAGLPCGGCPITRFYVIGGARFRRLFLMQSKRHRTRTRVRRRVLSPRRCKAGRPKRAPRRCANRAARKPLSRFPRGKPGRGKFPPRRQHRPAPPARGFSKRSAENPLARSRWGHNGESVQSETMRAAKQESEVFPLAALCLLTENSHQGHRLPTAVLHQGFTPTNSNTATGFAAFLYDSGRRSRSTGKERDTETGLDYFGARYYGSALGRFTSADEPFADQHAEDPQSWNLYSYARNNPLKFVDDTGAAVIYADEKLRIISDARRQESPSYNANLSGFEGPKSPDLTIRYGSTANDPDGSPTNGITSASISPAISTCTSATDCSISSPAVLKSATITVNDKIAGDPDQTSETLAHEASHGNDARTNPERYSNEKTTDINGKVIPHDARPVEQRAIGGANQSQQEVKQFKKEHKEEYKQIEKQKNEGLKQLRKDGSN